MRYGLSNTGYLILVEAVTSEREYKERWHVNKEQKLMIRPKSFYETEFI